MFHIYQNTYISYRLAILILILSFIHLYSLPQLCFLLHLETFRDVSEAQVLAGHFDVV